ncbi:hypothetical protein ACOMHN_009655 [Nucella lapillus]
MKSMMLLCVILCVVLVNVPVLAIDARCTSSSCQLPHCHCPGHGIPGGLKPEETPQMVLVTFDDAVNWHNWDMYLRLFPPQGTRRNPNGCPHGATFFVSHNSTDYCMVRKLHAREMEVADHSVTHRFPHAWWAGASKEEIAFEILTQRQQLADMAHIPPDHIRGWRSPFLQPSGDNMFEVLHENNFTYDATLTYPFPRTVYSPVLWPFTLDFSYPLVCNIGPCPSRPYPGVWVVPVVVVMDYREHKPCAYIDHCANKPRNHEETFEMLWKNFLRNYRTNRAPLYVNLHSKWLETDYHLDAMDDFLQRLSSMDDVYVLTVYKALSWMMQPTPLSAIKDFEPWKCADFRPNREEDQNCSLTARPRNMTSTTVSPTTTQFTRYYHTSRVSGREDRELRGLDHNGIGIARSGRRDRDVGKAGNKGMLQQGRWVMNGGGCGVVRGSGLIVVLVGLVMVFSL